MNKECANCGSQFTTIYTKQRFCGSGCKTYYGNHQARPLRELSCPVCSAVFTTHDPYTKHCSKKCSATSHPTPVKDQTCERCGVVFSFKGRTRAKYCPDCRRVVTNSIAQQQRALAGRVVAVGSGGNQWGERNSAWIQDRQKVTEVPSLSYRPKALAEWGESCVICGCKAPLHVHHINGVRKDLDIHNLVPLCISHHRKVHARRKQNEASLRNSLFRLWPEGQDRIAELKSRN